MRPFLSTLPLWLPGSLTGLLLALAVLEVGSPLLPRDVQEAFPPQLDLVLAGAVGLGAFLGLLGLWLSPGDPGRSHVERSSKGGRDVI